MMELILLGLQDRELKTKHYIHNKEIQEFLVEIKILFLRGLGRFISCRKIIPCRSDTFPIDATHRLFMYNLVPVLITTSLMF